MTVSDRVTIKAAYIPFFILAAFITQVQQLTTEQMDGEERLKAMNALLRVEPVDRAAFITQVNQLATEQMNGQQRADITKALSSVNVADRAVFINQVKQLITEQMDGNSRVKILLALSEVNAADRAFITLAQQLFREQMDGRSCVYIIEALSLVHAVNRTQEFITQLLLIAEQADHENDCNIVSFLDHANELERANTVARALLFMRNGNHAVFRQILETPLNVQVILGAMAAVAQGANPYAAGINVHAGKRDQATINAVRRLTEDWSPRQEEIDREFDDFWQAVRDLPNKTLQERLLRTLGVTLDGTVVGRSSGDFGGLLTGTNGQINLMHGSHALRINARELIARFWHFANTYMPEEVSIANSISAASSSSSDLVEKERANSRAAIMNGLAEGLQKDSETSDHVVCDPGKIQRLVMGTINGRLKLANGLLVDIDDIGLVNGDKKAAETETPQADPARGPQAAPMITNLNEIGQYLQPFIDNLTRQEAADRPQNGNEFFTRLFEYRNALADGRVSAFGGQRINLGPSEVVYYVRMMSPATREGGVIRVPAHINPDMSTVALLGFNDFQVKDYMRQFGARDRAQLAEARQIEADRALREQQDREHAVAAAEDLKRQQQNRVATNIQRIARGSLARKNVKVIQEQARAKAEFDKHVSDLRAAIVDGSAGTIVADADMLNALTDVERRDYTRLRRVHQLSK